MKIQQNFCLLLLIISLLLIPLLLPGEEFRVKVIKSSGDFPEKTCQQWKKGDFVISDGKKGEIKTRYNFFFQKGKIDILSTLKNTGN